MAKKEKKNKDSKKKKVKFSTMLFIASLVFLSIVLLPATVVLVIMMGPTFVALITDKDPAKTNTVTVGSMNIAGTIPSFVQLWQEGPVLITAEKIVTDPTNLLMAYGAAAVGWFIHLNVTPIVSAIIIKKFEIRMKKIEKQQEVLIKRWGKDVSGIRS